MIGNLHLQRVRARNGVSPSSASTVTPTGAAQLNTSFVAAFRTEPGFLTTSKASISPSSAPEDQPHVPPGSGAFAQSNAMSSTASEMLQASQVVMNADATHQSIRLSMYLGRKDSRLLTFRAQYIVRRIDATF